MSIRCRVFGVYSVLCIWCLFGIVYLVSIRCQVFGVYSVSSIWCLFGVEYLVLNIGVKYWCRVFHVEYFVSNVWCRVFGI